MEIPGVVDEQICGEFGHVHHAVCMDAAMSNKRALEYVWQHLPREPREGLPREPRDGPRKRSLFTALCRMHRKTKAHS